MSVYIYRICAWYVLSDSSTDSLILSVSSGIIFIFGSFEKLGLCPSSICIMSLFCSTIYCLFDIVTLVLIFRATAFLYMICAMQSSCFSFIDIDDELLIFTVIGLLFEVSMIWCCTCSLFPSDGGDVNSR